MRHREFDQDAQKAFLGIFAKERRSFESLQEHDGSVVSGRQILHSRPLVKVTGDSFAHLLRSIFAPSSSCCRRPRQLTLYHRHPRQLCHHPRSSSFLTARSAEADHPGNGGCGGGGAPGNGGCEPGNADCGTGGCCPLAPPGPLPPLEAPARFDCDEVALPPIGVGGASLGILEKSSYTFKATPLIKVALPGLGGRKVSNCNAAGNFPDKATPLS